VVGGERSAACSLTASKLDAAAKRWRRLVVHSVVSKMQLSMLGGLRL
jgi:hypothetical protein